MSCNKLISSWYKIGSRTRNAIESGGDCLQNNLFLNKEWSVAILKYKVQVAEITCPFNCSFLLLIILLVPLYFVQCFIDKKSVITKSYFFFHQ